MVSSCCSRNHPGPSIHDLTIHHEQLGIHQQDCFFCTQKESGVHGNLRNGTLITSQCPYKKWITAETNHWTLVLRKFPTENLGSPESTKHCVLGDMLRPSQSPELPQILVKGSLQNTLSGSLRRHFRTQPFWITSEHKITPRHTHTHQIYWQARDFGRKTRSKATPTQKTSSYENLTRFNHVIKSHACHVKGQSMYKSATPAIQNEGRCNKVPRLPQKMKVKIWNKSLVVLDVRSLLVLDVRRATRPLGFICCCTWCKDCHDTFRVYMLLHLM